ncbi:MAG: ribose-phosphate diphosphokinase [Alphaproteobacteria bacterium]|nr:MAG: ribose-phosphate diphosphokinase [Alphaproteobacteria bacterium]
MTATLHIWPGCEVPAGRLAGAHGLPTHKIDIHTFPDGESRVTVVPCAGTAILYVGLDHPNEKLVQLMLAATALKDGGATRLVLVCPYLCYMRQDMAFSAGQAVSQRVVGRWLADIFDRVITVDPHLHRIATLGEALPGIEADALSAAPLIAEALAGDPALRNAVLVGPDGESRQWVAAVAAQAGLDFIVAEKERFGDRQVQISLPQAGRAKGRPAVLVDDLVSSGATVCRAAALLQDAGATRIEVVAVHVLASAADMDRMRAAGVVRLQSTDSILHASNSISLTPLLVSALQGEG